MKGGNPLAVIIEMPKLGLSMQEGTVAKWLVNIGDQVKKGEAVLEVSTEKISNVVESPIDGVLLKINVNEGEVVPILTPLGTIGEPGEEITNKGTTPESELIQEEAKVVVEPELPDSENETVQTTSTINSLNISSTEISPVAVELASKSGINPSGIKGTGPGGRVLKRDVKTYLKANNIQVQEEEDFGTEMISPIADKLLKQAKIDSAKINGSGYQGRIVKKDVLTYFAANNIDPEVIARSGSSAPEQTISSQAVSPTRPDVKISPVAEKIAAEAGIDASMVVGTGPGERVMKSDVERYLQQTTEIKTSEVRMMQETTEVSQRRKVIAERMYQSLMNTAQATVSTTADVSELMQLYKSINTQLNGKLNLTAIFIKALSEVIQRFPQFNSYFIDDKIQYNELINVGLAVDVDEGLIVPVVKNAANKKLIQLSEEVKELAGKARESRLNLDDLSDGTITISNLGMFDIDAFTPILNFPESAILGIGRVKDVAMVKNGGIFMGKEMALSLTFDHRLIDGGPAARFLQSLKKLLENPEELLFN